MSLKHELTGRRNLDTQSLGLADTISNLIKRHAAQPIGLTAIMIVEEIILMDRKMLWTEFCGFLTQKDVESPADKSPEQ